MGFTDDVRQGLIERIGRGKRYSNNKRMADELGVDPSQLNRFLKKERGLNADSLGHILDKIGAKIIFGDAPADASKEVCFRMTNDEPEKTSSPDLTPEDYIAVPLTSLETAAQPGAIPENQVRGWMLVWRHLESIQLRSNFVAVQIETNDLSMAPSLHPGDIVLIDRDNHNPTPIGKMALVNAPGPNGRCMIRRVSTQRINEDLELIFYSEDNRNFPPATGRLETDYHGDISNAVSGSVIWSWNNMTHK